MLSKNQFDRVLDLDAARITKQRFGKAQRVSHTPDSPELTKHENEAMALGNPKKSRFQKVMGKVSYALGLDAFK